MNSIVAQVPPRLRALARVKTPLVNTLSLSDLVLTFEDGHFANPWQALAALLGLRVFSDTPKLLNGAAFSYDVCALPGILPQSQQETTCAP